MRASPKSPVISLITGSRGWRSPARPSPTSVFRYSPRTRIRVPRRLRPSPKRSATLPASAHCRSSSTRSNGLSLASVRRTRAYWSNRSDCLRGGPSFRRRSVARKSGVHSSGIEACAPVRSKRASSSSSVPTRSGPCAASAPADAGRRFQRRVACSLVSEPAARRASMSPVSWPRTSRNGRYRSPMPVSASHDPVATIRAGSESMALRQNSLARAVLPVPASPVMKTTRPSPADARSRCSRRRASSATRPTNGAGDGVGPDVATSNGGADPVSGRGRTATCRKRSIASRSSAGGSMPSSVSSSARCSSASRSAFAGSPRPASADIRRITVRELYGSRPNRCRSHSAAAAWSASG